MTDVGDDAKLMLRLGLPSSLHESFIEKHFKRDEDDSVLEQLHVAVTKLRKNTMKAAEVTKAVFADEMKTVAMRHKTARKAGYDLYLKATPLIDDAVAKAQAAIGEIDKLTRGPAPPRDLLGEARQREMREAFARLPEERRKGLIDEALKHDDDHLIGALLAVDGWVSGFAPLEQEMLRHRWSSKHFPEVLDRKKRIESAIADTQRIPPVALRFIDELTDRKLVESAEKMEKQAAEALKAAAAG